MISTTNHCLRAVLGASAVALAMLSGGPASAQDSAAGLKAKHAEVREQLVKNDFNRSMVIDSTESPNALKGDVYAVLDHPFGTVNKELSDPANWCDILILPFNTKYCRAQTAGGPTMLNVRIGKKADQPIESAYKIDFTFDKVASGTDYFESRLTAKEGPVGTRDYRIVVSAVPIDGKKTFLHLSYSYGYGMAGKMAMQAFLATVGAKKVGFSVESRDASGKPVYIQGVRGVIERNAMRYYLAIDAYMDALSAPVAERNDKRINGWFNETERYARQLHEMDKAAYVELKRGETERQQKVALQ